MTYEIVFDTETTGFYPSADGRGDRLVEIGCVELNGGIPTGRTYQQYINPQRSMPDAAFQVHGLDDALLSDKPIFSAIVDDFFEFIGNSKLIAHNSEFDMGFLNAELSFAGRDIIDSRRFIDTLALARKKYAGMGNSLDDLCERLGIDNSERQLHGALLDATLLAQVYAKLTMGEQTDFSLRSGAKSSSKASGSGSGYDTSMRVKGLVTEPSSSELENHESFLGSIKDCLWSR